MQYLPYTHWHYARANKQYVWDAGPIADAAHVALVGDAHAPATQQTFVSLLLDVSCVADPLMNMETRQWEKGDR